MADKPNVFVSRIIPDEGLAAIREACEMDLWDGDLPPPRDELLRRVAGCDGVLTLLTDRVDDEFLDAAGKKLRVVSNYAVGFDNIDVGACALRGIPVGNTPGVLTDTTADLAWALLMAAARRLPEGDRYVRDGHWKTWGPLLLLGPDVHGATIGIVGFDNVDVPACARRGITVGNTPGVLTETTADLAWALLMAAARRLPEGDRYVRDGNWKTWGPLLLLGPDVNGATIGIVGFGRIGQAMARRAQGFGMEVLYHDVAELPDDVTRPLGASYVPLEELLRRSDFVTLHVNLTDETRHLINATTLATMKPTAVLVNTSRGPVVDGAALAAALRDGVIWAAGLDVTDPEPIPMDDPLVGLDNCLIVPHIASASRATRGKMAAMAAANLIAGVRGEPLPTPVTPPG